MKSGPFTNVDTAQVRQQYCDYSYDDQPDNWRDRFGCDFFDMKLQPRGVSGVQEREKSMKPVILILAIAYLTGSVPAFAAGETFLCNMTRKDPGGRAQPFLQKFELDLDTRSVVFVENWGSGWEETGRGQFVDADDAGITLENNALLHTYINRATGEFHGEVLQDFSKLERGGSETVTYKRGTVFRGQCKQVGDRAARDVF